MVTVEGRKGNIPLYFHTQSDAAAESDPAGRGPGVEMWFIEELKEIRGVEVGVSFNCAICSVGLMKQIENHGVFVGVL